MNGVTPGCATRITDVFGLPAGDGLLPFAQPDATEQTTSSADRDSVQVVIRVQVCA